MLICDLFRNQIDYLLFFYKSHDSISRKTLKNNTWNIVTFLSFLLYFIDASSRRLTYRSYHWQLRIPFRVRTHKDLINHIVEATTCNSSKRISEG